MIEINNLIKEYNTSKKVVHASNDITYQFKSNGLHFILGKSGCGKTTLLNILSGLDSYDSGSVIVNGYNISKLTEKELDNYRNIHIGIIFQDFNLLQDINVYDNLKIVLKLQGSKCDEKNKLEQEDIKIEQILKEVGLEGYEKRKVSELSGGEKQRIAIARCLLKKTDIIFADEPTGKLDKKTGEAILDLLKQISKNRLVIVVSHDREAAYKYGDKIIHMSDGRIVSDDKGENNQILYSFNITDNKNISKDFENLDKMKMLEVVSKYIDNSQMKGELVIKDIVKNEKTHIEEENRAAEEVKNRTESIEIQAGDFLKRKQILQYLESYVSVADVGVISKDDLLEGRMPENNNEILISVDYAEKYDLLNNKYSSSQWNFSDIYKASYENTYSNMLNLYDYYKEGIEIVGIVAYLPEQVQRDFYVYEDKWKEIVNDYYKYYYGSYIVNADSQYYNEIIENADKTGIYFNEPAINNILDFDNLINEIKPILYLILIISMAINFIMIGTFIHISINENKKNIGILRSLGVTMNDCIQIFALEFLIMFICSVVIVVPIIIRIISMANNMYMDSLEEINYCIIDKSYIIFAIMFLVEITVNVLSIYIPIKAIRKKKPIEIINDR